MLNSGKSVSLSLNCDIIPEKRIIYVLKTTKSNKIYKNMNKTFKSFLALAMLAVAVVFTSCRDNDPVNPDPDPVPAGKVIVISDTHLCDQRAIDGGWGWQNEHRAQLVAFLEDVATRKDEVSTLVVAGDMFDEWVAPLETAPFQNLAGEETRSESDFFQVLVRDNKAILDAFRKVHDSGIELVYVPGNHDLTCTKEDFDTYLPGLFTQARDAYGMGAYTPVGMPEVVIEHGHRYDFSNMPNPVSTPGGYLPIGYVVSKYASTIALTAEKGEGEGEGSSLDDVIESLDNLLESPVGPPMYKMLLDAKGITDWLSFDEFRTSVNMIKADSEKIQQVLETMDFPLMDEEFNHFVSRALWLMVISSKPPKDLSQFLDLLFAEVPFPLPYEQSYRFCDIIPYFMECRTEPQDPVVFQRLWTNASWASLLAKNRVQLPLPFTLAAVAGGVDAVLDAMANIEYFENPLSAKRVVVFGHTHKGMLTAYQSSAKGSCIYANTGCWIDEKPGDSETGVTFKTYVELDRKGSLYTVTLREWGKQEPLGIQHISVK